MIEVLNLTTGEKRTYSLRLPENAVVAAYAQERGDWNTCDYGKYDNLVQRGAATVSCGDWTALREGK